MGLKEDRQFLKERKEQRNALQENAKMMEKKMLNEEAASRDDIISMREAAVENFYEYKDNVKKTLLKKALMEICTGSFHYINDREYAICENLVEQYIGESGTSTILKKMSRSNSCLLRSIAEEAKEYAVEISKDATADEPDSQVIDSTKVENFWKEVDDANDVEDITNTIRLRVSNAEEEFVNKNQEDKADIENILKDTSERIKNSANTNDNDYNDAVEVSESKIANEKIYKIRHEGYRNVFDRMVRNLSEVALTEDTAKDAFTTAGKLNMDSVVEAVRCMYTILEMVNTIGLEKVDDKFIEETIKTIR